MKKPVYILAFSFLGVLVQFLVHAGIEVWYIGLLLKDFPRYGLGLTWEQWMMIHSIGSVLLFIAGAWLGFRQGQYWWRKIYVEHALRRWVTWGSVRKHWP